MIPTLPRQARDRLAALILSALHDDAARATLGDLAQAARPAAGWLEPHEAGHHAALVERARRAATALRGWPRGARQPSLAEALTSAKLLFDAGLFFEVHELLEPHWQLARAGTREALQGLIQITVGYQHLANGNLAGAKALLADGAVRLRRGAIDGLKEVHAFVARVERAAEGAPGHVPVPPFPRHERGA